MAHLSYVSMVLWLLMLVGAFGQTGANLATVPPELNFAIEIRNTDTGLPQNNATAVLQTQRGYIWVGTYNGIAQFDGVRFRVFNSSNTKGLANSRITCLRENADGTIWIGHETGEVSRHAAETFTALQLPAHWSDAPIKDFATDEHDDTWVVNQLGEALRLRDGLIVKPTALMGANPFLNPSTIKDAQNRAYVVRNGVVARLTAEGYQPVNFGDPSERPYYAGLTPARDDSWWVVGEARLRKWNGTDWNADLGDFSWMDASVMTMLETSSGQLLVGTQQRGLFIFDPVTAAWSNLCRTNGLPQDWVCSLAEDSEKNLWVGTAGGLALLRQRKVTMQNPPDNWEGRPVHGLTRAQDGSIWAASEGAGIYRLHNGAWSHFNLDNLYVWSVLEDSQQRMWAGTWGGGLFRLDNNQFIPQTNAIPASEPVTALKEFPAGTLWIGTGTGLVRMQNNVVEHMAHLGGAAAGDVRVIESGPGGALWVGTQGAGLGRFQNNHFETFRTTNGLPADFILSLAAESDGTVWIGTLDAGLSRYRNGVFRNIDMSHGLPANIIFHIEDDQLGNLWFNSLSGLFRISKQQLNDCADGKRANVEVLALGITEGMATLAGTGGFTPSGFRALDGRLWFSTTRGIAVVTPKSAKPNPVPPPVWIEDVLIDATNAPLTTPTEFRQPLGKSAATARRLVILQPGRHQLDIQFTGLSFTAPERIQFKYRLEKFDADWSPASSRRVTYSYLPPGEYLFHVIACNSDGLWSQTGDTLAILVMPHFWQTWWFKALLIVAGGVILALTFFFESRRRLRRKLERIARERELERERARIAQDIHDDLGASLTRIGMLSQSAVGDMDDPPRATSSLNLIYETARDLTRAMDEIVWAVNPRHDTLDSLANYIARFAHDFLSAAQIRCRLDTSLQTPDLTVRSEIRHNLFLAFKETLNNAVKHSGATEVRVKLELPAGGLRLEVSDNGSGLAAAKNLPPRDRVSSGYGIAGIRSRLEQVGGNVQIHSTPGEGTRVELFVPLTGTAQLQNDR